MSIHINETWTGVPAAHVAKALHRLYPDTEWTTKGNETTGVVRFRGVVEDGFSLDDLASACAEQAGESPEQVAEAIRWGTAAGRHLEAREVRRKKQEAFEAKMAKDHARLVKRREILQELRDLERDLDE